MRVPLAMHNIGRMVYVGAAAAVVIVLALALAITHRPSQATVTAHNSPQTANDLFGAGFRAQIGGNLDGAVSDYKQAVAIDPKNVGSWYDLGVIAQARHQDGPAETYYRTALIVAPDYPQALYNLAILRTAGDPWEAIDLYRHLIALDPKDAKSHLNLGYALRSVNQADEGQAEIAVALRMDPSLAPSSPPK